MSTPRLTVAVAAYNPLPRITLAVQSALDQTMEDLEVLVIDDGSDVPVGPELPSDPRVRVIRHEVNQGYGAATTTTTQNARGEWIVWLDSDDTLAPEYASTMLARADRTGADVVIGRLQHGDGEGHTRDGNWRPPGDTSTGREAIAAVLREDVHRGQHAMFARRILTQPTAAENIYCDVIYMVRNMADVGVVAFEPSPYYQHYVHSGSITGSLRDSIWDVAGLPGLLAPTLQSHFSASEADELLIRARLMSLSMILHTAVREPRDTQLRRDVLAWCRVAISRLEVIAAMKGRRWHIAGSLALAKVAPGVHRRLYRLYAGLKEVSAQ